MNGAGRSTACNEPRCGCADGNKEVHPEGERRRRGGRGPRDKATVSNEHGSNDAHAQAAGETSGIEQTESVGDGALSPIP